MSDFLAEAKVLVRPDTTKFRAELTAQLKAITIPPIVVPVAASAAGLAAAAAGTAGLVAAQAQAEKTGLGLAATEEILNSRYAEQAVILTATSAATGQLAGSQALLDVANKKGTASLLGAGSAAGKLDAALLGLRTAVGSAAVIGLSALALAAIAAGKAISASIRNFAEFEQELATFRVVAGATADQMEAVRDAAQRLGADVRLPAVSAGDAAVAMTELAKAGLTVEEALAGVEGTLQLATAAQISNADAALIAANALNSFGLAGDQATKVADVLANAANAAQGSIADFGLAFKQSSAVARQVGLSLEDTTAILSLFAKNGLQGSDAGTSLRVALIRLVAPTAKAAAEIQNLGLKIRDAQGNVRADVFAQFGEATRNLTPAARDAAAALIFGQDAIRAVSIGAREGTDGLRLMQFEIDQQGTAAEVAAARTEGLAGALSGLQSSAETASISIGGLLAPALADIASATSDAIAGTQTLAAALKDLENAVPGGDVLGRVVGDLASFAIKGPAVVGIEQLGRGLRVFGVGVDETAKKVKELEGQLDSLQTARVEAERGGQSKVADALTKEIKALREQITLLKTEGAGIPSGVTAPLQKALDELLKVRDVRISLDVDTGPIDRLIASLRAQIPITQQVEGNIQRLRDDFGDLGSAASGGAAGVDALSAALARLTRESAAASDELLKAQNEGATPQAQIAILSGQRQTQEDIIANLKRGGIAAGEPSQIRAARQEINRVQGQIDSLLSQIESDAKSAAADVKERSDNIAQAQEDAARAFLAGFDPKRQKILNQITTAALTERLGDDIKFQQILVRFLKNEIEQIKDRIKRLKLHGDALKVARDAIKAINQEIFNLLNNIAQDQKDQQARAQAVLGQKLDFRIQIAQAQDNVAAELRARRAKLAQITKELIAAKKEFGKNSLQWLELKAAQAEQIAAIKELEKQNKTSGLDARKQAAEFLFSQLQAQQGFAANLMGNLIPTGQTAGLVGVPAPPAPGRAVAAESLAAEGKRTTGPTAGLQVTTNDILGRILQELRKLNGSYDAPEAIHQKKFENAMGDIWQGF